MKISLTINQLLCVAYVMVLLFSSSACTKEQVMPVPDEYNKESPISFRTDGPVNPQLVKMKVSQRDNIPLLQIETCSYYGQTIQGFWEYHLTTTNNGPKIYTVIQIIGDDCDGF